MTKSQIHKVFKAIADPTRREIFHVLILASSALSINQLSEHFDISRQGVTKHLKLLQEAQLVQIRNQGREKFCQANPKPLEEIKEWVSFYEKFWDDKLKKLGDYLDNTSDS